MFSVHYFKDPKNANDGIELRNSDNSCYAKIDLGLGGSLQELKLGNKVLVMAEGMPYHSTFASSILFPFTNRIENGKYRFNNKNFQLQQNEPDKQNALHGLVFGKTFSQDNQGSSSDNAWVELSFQETQPISGFPFKYRLKLRYILSENSLELKVEVKNNDQWDFPFSLGWHPYFRTSDLQSSHLKISSSKKLEVNDKMIPKCESKIDLNGLLKIEEQTFDDCFVLNTNKVEFKTPEYHLELEFSPENKYLQLYTPNDRKSIAIEPQTAPANCFNTGVGIRVLKPNETYNLSWKINIK